MLGGTRPDTPHCGSGVVGDLPQPKPTGEEKSYGCHYILGVRASRKWHWPLRRGEGPIRTEEMLPFALSRTAKCVLCHSSITQMKISNRLFRIVSNHSLPLSISEFRLHCGGIKDRTTTEDDNFFFFVYFQAAQIRSNLLIFTTVNDAESCPAYIKGPHDVFLVL